MASWESAYRYESMNFSMTHTVKISTHYKVASEKLQLLPQICQPGNT